MIMITLMIMMMMAHLRATTLRWRMPSPPAVVSLLLIDVDHDNVDDDGAPDGNHPEVERAHADCYVKSGASL